MARKPPSYRLHKPSGNAVVTLGGRDHYLGEHGTAESRERYHRLLADWEAAGRKPTRPAFPDDAPAGPTVTQLIHDYWQRRVQVYYRKPDGTPTSTHTIKSALRRLKRLYGTQPAASLGPLDLQRLRDAMIAEGLARSTINQQLNLIRQMYRWAVAQEVVPVAVYQALLAVEALAAGRSGAKESREVKPVPLAHVEAIEPHVSRQVWAVVQLQLLTGARSGEVLPLRPIDIDTSGEVWIAELATHKTAHRGKTRSLYFGPKAQAVIRPFLDRPVASPLFSAAEAFAELRAAKATKRRRDGQPETPRETPRQIRDHYTADTYYRAVQRGCIAAGVPHWHPHQLRHTYATATRRAFGIEVSQAALGHAVGSKITEIYAEADAAKVRAIALKIG